MIRITCLYVCFPHKKKRLTHLAREGQRRKLNKSTVLRTGTTVLNIGCFIIASRVLSLISPIKLKIVGEGTTPTPPCVASYGAENVGVNTDR